MSRKVWSQDRLRLIGDARPRIGREILRLAVLSANGPIIGAAVKKRRGGVALSASAILERQHLAERRDAIARSR